MSYKKTSLLPRKQRGGAPPPSTDPMFNAMQQANAPAVPVQRAVSAGYKKAKIAGAAKFSDPGAWSSLVKGPSAT